MTSKTNLPDFIKTDCSPQKVVQALQSGCLLLVYGRGTALLAHSWVEYVLSSFLQIQVSYPSLTKNFRGKPFLPDFSLYFNVSHTKNAFLLAFYTEGEVGVDIELIEPQDDYEPLAEYAFSPDERKMLSDHPSVETFLKIWTMKEAYLKATGIGMVDALTALHIVSATGFGVMDERYGSLVVHCPGGETGSVVCTGKMPGMVKCHIVDCTF